MIERRGITSEEEAAVRRLPTVEDDKILRMLKRKIKNLVLITREDTEDINEEYVFDKFETLFSLKSGEFIPLEDFKGRSWKTIGKVGQDHLQELGLEVMRRYGFSEDNVVPGMTGQSIRVKDDDNSIGEVVSYFSSKRDGLVFMRAAKSDLATGMIIDVIWRAGLLSPDMLMEAMKKE
ncbi:MAG: hypothetical protein HY425_01210 [Candidatus Levybacteria bacterium]|nr:hypothetical protein [Candidatus Levybacteria bacterium]